MGGVVELINYAGIPADGTRGLVEWARAWLDALERGDHGDIQSMAIVLESKKGQVAVLSQAIVPMDTARLIGLLTVAAHVRADGGAKIEDLR